MSSNPEKLERLKQPKSMSMYASQGDMISDLLIDRSLASAEIDRLQRENASLRCAQTYTYIGRDGKSVLARDLEDRAEAAEAEVARLQTELAMSKPLYSRRQIEARVKLLEEALKPFADLAECYDPDENDGDLKCWHDGSIPKIKDLRRARKALASTGGEHHGN